MRRLTRKTRGGRKRSRNRRRLTLYDRIEPLLTWHHDAAPWQRRLAAAGLAVVAVVLLIGMANWILQANIPSRIAASVHNATVNMTLGMGFAIREVYVADRDKTPQPAILEALETKIGDPILFFDVDEARERLLAIGWIEDARVERRLPNRLMVVLKERQPVAIWQNQKEFLLVDGDGIVIGPKAPGEFSDLKIIIGRDAPQHAMELLALLDREPDLMARVTHATWVSGRQWTIRIENAIDVKLPAGNPEDAWRRLADMEREFRVLNRNITTVDLRIPDKTSVRVNGRPEKVADRENQT
ncbi:MAG: cell division protein FtsQ/DivIB [Pseudomonadota bacterium]